MMNESEQGAINPTAVQYPTQYSFYQPPTQLNLSSNNNHHNSNNYNSQYNRHHFQPTSGPRTAYSLSPNLTSSTLPSPTPSVDSLLSFHVVNSTTGSMHHFNNQLGDGEGSPEFAYMHQKASLQKMSPQLSVASDHYAKHAIPAYYLVPSQHAQQQHEQQRQLQHQLHHQQHQQHQQQQPPQQPPQHSSQQQFPEQPPQQLIMSAPPKKNSGSAQYQQFIQPHYYPSHQPPQLPQPPQPTQPLQYYPQEPLTQPLQHHSQQQHLYPGSTSSFCPSCESTSVLKLQLEEYKRCVNVLEDKNTSLQSVVALQTDLINTLLHQLDGQKK